MRYSNEENCHYGNKKITQQSTQSVCAMRCRADSSWSVFVYKNVKRQLVACYTNPHTTSTQNWKAYKCIHQREAHLHINSSHQQTTITEENTISYCGQTIYTYTHRVDQSRAERATARSICQYDKYSTTTEICFFFVLKSQPADIQAFRVGPVKIIKIVSVVVAWQATATKS